MRECMQEVKSLLKAKIDFIWIDSYEEAEVIKDLVQLVNEDFYGSKIFSWSMTEGLRKVPLNNMEKKEDAIRELRDPLNVLNHIINAQNDTNETKNEAFYVLRDLHTPLENIKTVTRAIRDAKETMSRNYNPIIVVSPITYVPLELEKIIHIVKYDTPSKNTISRLIANMANKMRIANNEKGKSYTLPDIEEQEHLVDALAGLTYREIKDTLALSLIEYNSLSLQAIMEEKIQLIKKSGVLDYKVPEAIFEEVGGNENFKNWISDVELAMSDQARAFGCAPPKGYLALGLPGTAR